MHPPSIQTLVLTLATLAIGGTEGLKLRKRADPVDTSNTQGVQNILITDAAQKLFYTPMQFGSGDGAVSTYGLVSTTRGDIILPSVYTKNLTGFVTQGKSVAEGPIYAGPVSAGGWSVPDQDIVYYENHNAVLPISSDNGYAYAGYGIWPNSSTVYQAFGDWSAEGFVARILAEPNAEPYWTLLIHPFEDDQGSDLSFGGVLTIGEIVNLEQIFNVTQDDLTKGHVPDLTQVANYPTLNNKGVWNDTSYYILIDAISWGNHSATLKSTVPGTPDSKISAYIDSTDAWIHVPYSITEELYKNLEGASYAKDTGIWSVKCTELTITITIAGHAYPISPLTAVGHVDSFNCVGNFRAKPDGAGGDIVLGVPFLKNVYARFAYETKRDSQVYDPFVQLLPVTDVADAHNDWVAAYEKWGSHTSVSGSSGPTPLPTSLTGGTPTPLTTSLTGGTPTPLTTPSPTSSSTLASGGSNHIAGAVEDDDVVQGGAKKSGSKSKTKSKIGRFLIAIVIGVVVLCLLVVGCIVFAVMKMRKGRDGKGSYRGLGKPEGDVGPVNAPLYDTEGSGGRYGEGGQGRYTDPYTDR